MCSFCYDIALDIYTRILYNTNMNRITLPMLIIKSMYRKWRTVPNFEQYYESDSATFPAMLGYFHDQGWDLIYVKGEYTIPTNQLDFFLLSL